MPRSSLLFQPLISLVFHQLCFHTNFGINCNEAKGVAKECLSLTPFSPLSFIADDAYRYDQSSVLNDSSIYVFGGSGVAANPNKGDSNEYIRLQIIKVDDNTGTIEYNLNKTLMAHGVQDHASIVYKDSVYIFGGILSDSSYTNKLYEMRSYPPVGNFIIPGVVQPTARAGHSAILHNHKIVIFGGRLSTNIALNDVMYFDLKETYDARANMTEWLALRLNWTILEPGPRSNIPPARYDHASLKYNGKMYIFGGANNDPGNMFFQVYDDLYSLNLDNWVWKKIVTIGNPGKRHRHTVVLFQSTMIAYGGLLFTGRNSLDVATNSMVIIDLEADNGIYRWKSISWNYLNVSEPLSNNPKYPKLSYGHSSVIYKDHFLRIFGTGQGSFSYNDIQFISLCACSLCQKGKFKNNITKKCEACPNGTANSIYGATRCYNCLPGFHSNQRTHDGAYCMPCGQGKFSTGMASATCNACGEGKYSDMLSSTSCKACLSGKYNEQVGQNDCKPCSLGKYNPLNLSKSTQACLECLPGYYQDSEGSVVCKSCPQGSFSVKGSSYFGNCKYCPQPKFCIASLGQCYGNRDENTHCLHCKPGMYKSFLGLCKFCAHTIPVMVEILTSLYCVFNVFLVFALVQANDMGWLRIDSGLKNELDVRKSSKSNKLHGIFFSWIRHFQALYLFILIFEIPKDRETTALNNLFNLYMPLYSLSVSKYTTYTATFLQCSFALNMSSKALLLIDIIFGLVILIIPPVFVLLVIFVNHCFCRYHLDTLKAVEKKTICLMNGIMTDILTTYLFPVALMVVSTLTRCNAAVGDNEYILELDGGHCIWNFHTPISANFNVVRRMATSGNESNGYNNNFIGWFVFLMSCCIYLVVYIVELVLFHWKCQRKRTGSLCKKMPASKKCFRTLDDLKFLFAKPPRLRDPLDDVTLLVIVVTDQATSIATTKLIIIIAVLLIRTCTFFRSKWNQRQVGDSQMTIGTISPIFLQILQLGVCVVYIVREYNTGFVGYNTQKSGLNKGLYTEATDIIYFVAFLAFPIHVTLYLCLKWYYCRIKIKSKSPDLVFQPKRWIPFFGLYVICILCMLPTICICLSLHVISFILRGLIRMFKSCLTYIVELREQLSTHEVCKRTIKDLQLHLYSFGSTMVFLYYTFATSCEACEAIFSVRRYTDEDYAAEKMWEKHVGRSHKVFPTSIEISVDGNDSSTQNLKKKYCSNAKGRIDTVQRHMVSNHVVFEEIDETDGKRIEDDPSFYGIWGSPQQNS